MKKYLVAFTLFTASFASCAIAQNKFTATKKLTKRTPQEIVNYLDRLIKDSLIVVGQHCGGEDYNQTKGYNMFFENLYTLSGKYPGLLGFEYGARPNVDFEYINKTMINHSNKGGLVCVTWHADNPFTEGYNGNWNSVTHKDSINLKALLSTAPESPEKASYWKELMNVAKHLKELQDAGVVPLWRPFHEMNGTWFWWGPNDTKAPTNAGDFQLLWQDMHAVFAKLGITELVWVYSPNNPYNAVSKESVLTMYPGDKYVHLVGLDIYKAPVPAFTDNYELLKKLNKTIVIGECGDDIDNQGVKVLDEVQLLNTYRGKAAYFMQWHSWTNPRVKARVRRAIVENVNAKEMMNHPAAVTLSDMKK